MVALAHIKVCAKYEHTWFSRFWDIAHDIPNFCVGAQFIQFNYTIGLCVVYWLCKIGNEAILPLSLGIWNSTWIQQIWPSMVTGDRRLKLAQRRWLEILYSFSNIILRLPSGHCNQLLTGNVVSIWFFVKFTSFRYIRRKSFIRTKTSHVAGKGKVKLTAEL